MTRPSQKRIAPFQLGNKAEPKGNARRAAPPVPFVPRLGPAFLHAVDVPMQGGDGGKRRRQAVGTGHRTPVAARPVLPDQITPDDTTEALAVIRSRWSLELRHQERLETDYAGRRATELRTFLIVTDPTRRREVVAGDLHRLRGQLEREWKRQQELCSLDAMTDRILEAVAAQVGQDPKPGATVIQSQRWNDAFLAVGDDPGRMMHMAICDGYVTAATNGVHRLTAEGRTATRNHLHTKQQLEQARQQRRQAAIQNHLDQVRGGGGPGIVRRRPSASARGLKQLA